MIIESASAGDVSLSSTATAGAKEIAMPKGFWIAHAITIATGIGLQLVGLYAAAVTFGAWVTLGLYAVGGLAVFLRHLVVWRATSCSLGD
jgi:hypothetical protein